jgi:hypothetical protein
MGGRLKKGYIFEPFEIYVRRLYHDFTVSLNVLLLNIYMFPSISAHTLQILKNILYHGGKQICGINTGIFLLQMKRIIGEFDNVIS